MATTAVQTPCHSKSSLQRGQDAEQTGKHTVLHRPRSTNWAREENDEILPHQLRSPKHHPRISLVRGLTTKDRLGKRMDGLRPTTSCVEDFKLQEPQNPTKKRPSYERKRRHLRRICHLPIKRSNSSLQTGRRTRQTKHRSASRGVQETRIRIWRKGIAVVLPQPGQSRAGS